MPLLPYRDDYGDHLADMGFKYPTHKKPGRKYINVHGRVTYADPNKRIMLVTYRPFKSESYFRRLSDAQAALKRDKPSPIDWQIVDSFTGKVFDYPRDWKRTHANHMAKKKTFSSMAMLSDF